MLDDILARDLINRYQGGFPIVEQPFAQAADALGCDESRLLDLLQQQLQEKWLSRFGPLFDAKQMGGGFTLAALKVPEERFKQVTEIVNNFPEVSHNYQRDHALNMWFVVATETTQGITQTIQRIEEQTGLKVYNCPKIQEFFVGLKLFINEQGEADTVPMDAEWLQKGPSGEDGILLSPLDRKIIAATQAGLPLVAAIAVLSTSIFSPARSIEPSPNDPQTIRPSQPAAIW